MYKRMDCLDGRGLGAAVAVFCSFNCAAFNCSLSAATKMSPFQLVYGRHPPLIGLNQSLALCKPFSDYADQLRKNIEVTVERARKNNIKAKENFADRYNEKNRSQRWRPFKPGDKVKYVNHYPNGSNRKFSPRYLGPFVVECRRGVNYRIVGHSQSRPLWVHHDELRPWLERRMPVESGKPSVSTQTGEGEHGEDLGSGLQDETSSSSSSSDESEDHTREQDAVGVRSPVLRNRRPPVWMKDYYTH